MQFNKIPYETVSRCSMTELKHVLERSAYLGIQLAMVKRIFRDKVAKVITEVNLKFVPSKKVHHIKQ